jgi:hypothetical protein
VACVHIGLDLDNTIIDYNGAFPAVAAAMGFLDADEGLRDKASVKARLISQEGGMDRWMRLQGKVYGPCLDRAQVFDGVRGFLGHAKAKRYRISIVSHKTQFGHYDETGTNLRDAARAWLISGGLVGDGDHAIRNEDVFFETTRDAKIQRIRNLGCEVFVDDLLEVLTDKNFPHDVLRVWFSGASEGISSPSEVSGLTHLADWRNLAALVDSFASRDRDGSQP